MASKFTELFGTETVVIDGHAFVLRKPTTAEGIAWFKGIPSLNATKNTSVADSLPDPAMVAAGIEQYLVSVDGEAYDPKENPASEMPFAIALPLYNAVFRLAVPREEAEAAGRVLRG